MLTNSNNKRIVLLCRCCTVKIFDISYALILKFSSKVAKIKIESKDFDVAFREF